MIKLILFLNHSLFNVSNLLTATAPGTVSWRALRCALMEEDS